MLTDRHGDEHLVIPMPEQLERSLGFPPGYTASTVSASGRVKELSRDDRRGLLGDVFGIFS